MTLCAAAAVRHKRHSAMRPGEDVGTRRERRRRKWRKWRKWRGGGVGGHQSVLECTPAQFCGEMLRVVVVNCCTYRVPCALLLPTPSSRA